MKIHWEGLAKSFDHQWIPKSDSVDVPDAVDLSDAYSHLLGQLFIQVS